MLTATAWMQLEPVMLLEGNLIVSTRGYSVVLWVVGLILCGRRCKISGEVTASAGVSIFEMRFLFIFSVDFVYSYLYLRVYSVAWTNNSQAALKIVILYCQSAVTSDEVMGSWWCLSDEWDEVSKSSQLIYISSGLKTYLRLHATASSYADWSMQGLWMSLYSGWICAHQSCVLRRCVFRLCFYCNATLIMLTLLWLLHFIKSFLLQFPVHYILYAIFITLKHNFLHEFCYATLQHYFIVICLVTFLKLIAWTVKYTKQNKDDN